MASALQSKEETLDLRRLWDALRSRWWVVVLTVLLVGGGFYAGAHLFPTTYTATARLVYEPVDLAGIVGKELFSGEEFHNIQSDALAIETRTLADRVAAKLEGSPPAGKLVESVSAETIPELPLVAIHAKASTAETAASIANAYASEYVLVRQERAREIVSSVYSTLGKRIAALSVTEAQSDYGLGLKQYHDELGVQVETQRGDFSILDPALASAASVSPNAMLAGQIGVLFGFLAGLALALLLEYLDKRIKDETTLEHEFGVPLLATIPTMGKRWGAGGTDGRPYIGFGEGKEALLESARLLRSTLKLMGFGKTCKTILITSAVPQQGKTTTAVNLALAMALSGDRVILVDGDLRMPRVHDYLALPNEEGLEDVLLSRLGWKEAAQPVDLDRFAPAEVLPLIQGEPEVSRRNLYCLTSGSLGTSAAELLESPEVEQLLSELRRVSDYVIVDGPPLLTVSDSLGLLKWVDAVVLTSRLGGTRPEEAAKLRKLLQRAGAKVLGVVLVGGKARTDEHYYYYYHHRSPGPAVRAGLLSEAAGDRREIIGAAEPFFLPDGTERASQRRVGQTELKRARGTGKRTASASTSLAFLADVHGNLLALQATLADLEQRGLKGVFCLGDLVGYGPEPNEVVSLVRERGIPTILGDHDDAVAFDRGQFDCYFPDGGEATMGQASYLFTTAVLSQNNKAWLRGLPEEREVQVERSVLHLVHASPRRLNEYLSPDREERTFLRIAQREAGDVLLFGHTHLAWHRTFGRVLFVNVGSVGRPKDGDCRATYTIVHLGRDIEPRVEVARVAYDVEETARAVVRAGLPSQLAEAIRQGG